MRATLIALAAVLGLVAGPTSAVGPESDTARFAELERAIVLIDAGAYRGAIRWLQRARQIERDNADVFNLLGFAHRNLGETDAALAFYARALELDPDHLGANEYLGELYLQLGEPQKAQERLTILAVACDDCEEFQDLRAAIAAHTGS